MFCIKTLKLVQAMACLHNQSPLRWKSGPNCSKLTTLLVDVFLKFQMLISNICQYFFVEKNVRSFCSAKASLIFATKNFSIFSYKVLKQ